MRPEAVLRQGPIFFAGDVDPQPAAEILEDELGLRPGGEENYRGPPQTRDEAQTACPVRAQGAGRAFVSGAVFGAGRGLFAPRSARSVFLSGRAPREHPVVPLGVFFADVDSHPAAETLEDELGPRPGGEGNYRGPLQTRDEAQSAMPARFAPKAPAVVGFGTVSGPVLRRRCAPGGAL